MFDFQQHEGAFRQLLDSAADTVVVVNSSGIIVLANSVVERMFGFKPEQLIGNKVEVLLPEMYRIGHEKLREGYFEQPSVRFMGTDLILHAQRKDGSKFPVEVSLSPIDTKNGLLVTSSIRDISDRIKIQQELEQHVRELDRSNAELEQFAYVASHDLQEPLRVIASFAQLLGRRYQGKLDKDADEFIDYIVDGASRMQELINDLLTFSRISSKGKEFESTDCNVVLQRVLQDLKFAIAENKADVTWDTLPTILADASQLGQLFQNLIGNAIKFHGEQAPCVRISVRQEADDWVFSVQDDGIGIEPKYADRIFLLFQRLHGKEEYKGTGIGLAICKKIVERHGGRIWLESQPDQGAIFKFTIPKGRV